MKRSTAVIKPVTPRMRIIKLVQTPAARICPRGSCSEIATVAMAFMGCTAMGMEKAIPVRMLNRPAKNRAEVKSNPLVMLIPISSGRNVPKSPSEPEISRRSRRGSAGKPGTLPYFIVRAPLPGLIFKYKIGERPRFPNTLLKVSFPFAASNPKTTYDLGLGTIERGNNSADRYEVPAQKWADLTDAAGAFGAAVLNDSKYGWDKPADNVLRLTLLHTPLPKAYPYQGSNDLGHHRFVYAIAGHRGDWRSGRVPARAAALNQPLVAFQTTPHAGLVGPSVSMLSLDDSSGQVALVALKKAEDTDEIVLRLQEQYGRPAKARIRFPGEISAAREINAAEERVGDFPASGSELIADLRPYQPRTFALRLSRTSAANPARAAVPLNLPFNLDDVSTDADRTDGDFDGRKHTLAVELLPEELELDGIHFKFGPSAAGVQNVLVPKGQRLALPSASLDHLYILAAAVGGDVTASIGAGSATAPAERKITVREWEGAIGQWDSRLKDLSALREPFVPANKQEPSEKEIRAHTVVPWDPQTFALTGIDQIRSGFVKRDEIAWVGTHRHAADGNQPYILSYVFAYEIDLPAGTREIRLPNEDRLRILAMTAVREPHHVQPTAALYAPELPEPQAAPARAPSRSGIDFLR